MKFIFLLGGLTGFLLTILAGGWAGRAPDRLLLDAAVAAVVGGLLFRWLWSVALGALREARTERDRAAAPPVSVPAPGPETRPGINRTTLTS